MKTEKYGYENLDYFLQFRMLPEENYKPYNLNLISGDSGNPSFAVIESELVLISTHWMPSGDLFIGRREGCHA